MTAEGLPDSLRIAFVLSSIDRGGAERQLMNLADGLIERRHTVVAAVVRPGGQFEDRFRERGIEVVPLARSWKGTPMAVVRFAWLLRRRKIDVVHGFMLAGNVVAALGGRLGRRPYVFGIRGTIDEAPDTAGHRRAHALEARLARAAGAVVANSDRAADESVQRGMPADRVTVVHNGIDVEHFRIDHSARRRVRATWGTGEDEVVVGRVARVSDTKDYPTFIEAAAMAAQRHAALRFVAIGDGMDGAAADLRGLASSRGLDPERLLLLEGRSKVSEVMNGLDIHVLSSTGGESFPNVVGEAMACGVPSVVADIAAAPEIVGDVGIVVPMRDPVAMADAVLDLAARIRRGEDLARACRRRVEELFPVERMVRETEAVLRRVVLAAEAR